MGRMMAADALVAAPSPLDSALRPRPSSRLTVSPIRHHQHHHLVDDGPDVQDHRHRHHYHHRGDDAGGWEGRHQEEQGAVRSSVSASNRGVAESMERPSSGQRLERGSLPEVVHDMWQALQQQETPGPGYSSSRHADRQGDLQGRDSFHSRPQSRTTTAEWRNLLEGESHSAREEASYVQSTAERGPSSGPELISSDPTLLSRRRTVFPPRPPCPCPCMCCSAGVVCPNVDYLGHLRT